ncbi:MAG: DUF3426 domain-containing protein [Polaromonas sp.]
MSLITRCPACATMFKFVPDQLKVARGWVRCGQCGEVFEALLHLVPAHPAPALDQTAARPVHETPEVLPYSAVAVDGLAENRMDAPDSAPALTPGFAESLQEAPTPQNEAGAQALATAEAPPEQQALPQEAPEIESDTPPAAIPSAMDAAPDPARIEPTFICNAYAFKPDGPPLAEPVSFSVSAHDEAPLSAELPDAADDVSFVRDAQRKAFWKTPLVRTVLGLLFILLLAALTLQWMVRQKDVLAAQEPRLAPLLQALCRPLGCEIRPLRRIESVLIDSANFSKSGPNAYRLTFVLKNTGAAGLEIPALEVTLTDSQDQALVRRVLVPAQFGVTAATLEAHSELAGAVSLTLAGDGDQAAAASPQAGALPVAGYRILAFYP